MSNACEPDVADETHIQCQTTLIFTSLTYKKCIMGMDVVPITVFDKAKLKKELFGMVNMYHA